METQGRNPENEFKDRPVRIATGKGIVKTDTWAYVDTPWGATKNVCLPNTARTHSAGDCNAKFGVCMSWLSPDSTPSEIPGTCILHRPNNSSTSTDWSHVVWHGKHDIVVPRINSNTPDLADGDTTVPIEGTFCATAGCGCDLAKLSNAAAVSYTHLRAHET